MVDGLGLEEGDVELVVDQGLADVGLEIDVAAQVRQTAQARAFVGDGEALADPEREGRVEVEEQGGGVVVVEEHQHVRLLGGQPFGDRLVAREQRRPGRVILFLLVIGHPDGGDVRRADAADDPGHGQSPRDFSCASRRG